eukprot:m.546 g.546  ORF g.546 m.546 type:complete len:179 (-) comp369_c0_seq1:126-662(-)
MRSGLQHAAHGSSYVQKSPAHFTSMDAAAPWESTTRAILAFTSPPRDFSRQRWLGVPKYKSEQQQCNEQHSVGEYCVTTAHPTKQREKEDILDDTGLQGTRSTSLFKQVGLNSGNSSSMIPQERMHRKSQRHTTLASLTLPKLVSSEMRALAVHSYKGLQHRLIDDVKRVSSWSPTYK